MSDRRLEGTRPVLRELVSVSGLAAAAVTVLAKPLTPEEAIGTPGRRDFPILAGKERVVEARLGSGTGHAFTDTAREFTGRLQDVLDLEFSDNGRRTIYVATLNAVLRHLGRAAGTVHCRDDDPECCGSEIAATLQRRFGRARLGLIGFNPAIAEHLVRKFGSERLCITDLNPENTGRHRFGVEILDGETDTDQLLERSDVVLVTGTTFVNGTFDRIWDGVLAHRRHGIVFGVTGAGVCELLGLERLCPFGRDG